MTWTQALQRALADPETLMADSGNGEALRPLLMRLCAAYLLERRPLLGADGGTGGAAGPGADADSGGREAPQRVRDPVAHFHFGNGALLHGLHWRCGALLHVHIVRPAHALCGGCA